MMGLKWPRAGWASDWSYPQCGVYYPHMPIGKVWIYRLLFVCLFVFVRLRISSPRMKLAASYFWFVGVQGGNLPFCELCSTRSQKSDESWWPARWPIRPIEMRPTFVEYRAACWRRIGMCGYTAASEDRRTCWLYFIVYDANDSMAFSNAVILGSI